MESNQNAHCFKSGLIANNCNQYTREITHTDYIAYLLGKNHLKKPKAAQLISDDGLTGAIKWQPIEVNDDNKFFNKELTNGCLYLTYDSNCEQIAILHVSGYRMLYINGIPRGGDMYAYGWMYLPIKLRKGINEIFILGSAPCISATLTFPSGHAIISLKDTTFPNIVLGRNNKISMGGLVIINPTDRSLTELDLVSQIEGRKRITKIPTIPPLTFRKIAFEFDTSGVVHRGAHISELQLLENGIIIDQNVAEILALEPQEPYSDTFISEIDGSIQYYSIVPQSASAPQPPALILALHGREVFSLNLAHAHRPKSWGIIVVPTNRRPRGFTWEDWGRLDAIEVLDIAKKKFRTDASRVYLTGHSMGGRGTWYLGATYPGMWAAIAPCAGYATNSLKAPEKETKKSKPTNIEQVISRAGNASNVLELIHNYKACGVFILHGDDDEIIPVTYSRRMKKLLNSFHHDLNYQEQPGGAHWYGNASVDSEIIFDYFKQRTIPTGTQLNQIDFTSANPAISSTMHWLSIIQQEYPLKFSRVKANRSIEKKIIEINTKNIAILKLSLEEFHEGEIIKIITDGFLNNYKIKSDNENIHLYKNKKVWRLGSAPSPVFKGPHRYGTFKEAFKNKMVFVYGTIGNEEESNWNYNKARYDAETWYYRANGAVEIITDKQFSISAYKHRSVILYGNRSTNSAWDELLADCPINVQRGQINVGETTYVGDEFGAYFIWPRCDNPTTSIAVICGTGSQGMRAAEGCQYFHHQAQFPDFMIFNLETLIKGLEGIKMAGFFGNDWSLERGEIIK